MDKEITVTLKISDALNILDMSMIDQDRLADEDYKDLNDLLNTFALAVSKAVSLDTKTIVVQKLRDMLGK